MGVVNDQHAALLLGFLKKNPLPTNPLELIYAVPKHLHSSPPCPLCPYSSTDLQMMGEGAIANIMNRCEGNPQRFFTLLGQLQKGLFLAGVLWMIESLTQEENNR